MYQFDTISKFTTGFCLHMIRLDQVNFLSADILNIYVVSRKKAFYQDNIRLVGSIL